MTPIYLLTISIFAPLALGLAGLSLPRSWVGVRVGLMVLGPLSALVLLGYYTAQYGYEQGPVSAAWMPELRLDLGFHADRLGLFFAFLVSGVGLLIVLYARAYFGPDADALYRFYPSLMLFMTAMIGVALADNFMLLLLFWEMTSISSFLLIGWERDDAQAVRNAMQAFVVTGAGGLVLMGGLIWMGVLTGSWTFSDLLAMKNAGMLEAGPGLTAAFAMIFFGAAAKSAQWPLHFWLPGAMAAPTPVSAYLHSATMVKAGVYLVGRLWPILAVTVALWPAVIVPLGAITMVLGAFVALQKSDLKQIFAYTTVSQLGLLMCMYGLSAFEYRGEPNLLWDVTQILNHALYKAPLFILAGAIAHVAHTRELAELKGLFRRSRDGAIMTVVVLLAAYAMAAGPLTVSFTAKEFFFYGIWHAYEATDNPLLLALVGAGVATGALNVAIFIRLARTLLGESQMHPPAPPVPPGHDIHGEHDYGAIDPHHDHEHALGPHPHEQEQDAHGHDGHVHETGLWPQFLWIPGALVVAFQYLGGIVPGAYEFLFGGIEANVNYKHYFPLTWQAEFGVPLLMSLLGFMLGTMLGFAPWCRRVIRDRHEDLYPAFYTLVTRGGGRVFGLMQTGHLRTYLAVASLAIVGVILWASWATPGALALPGGIEFEYWEDLLPGYLLAGLVCLAAVLMPVVKGRATRVLMLGTAGFAVTGVFYLYNAPDLALTQIAIEIVALVMFLLVLSMLPRTRQVSQMWFAPRLLVSVAVGAAMFWVALTSATSVRPEMPHLGEPVQSLGDFFLRNSYHGADMPADPGAAYGRGGGGNNVVNVILVDFRSLDTLGEIAVLGLAAVGVWVLLRRRRRRRRPAAGRGFPVTMPVEGSGGT